MPVKTADFQWESSLNFSHNKNKLVSLSNNVFKLDSIYPATASPGGQNQTGAYVQILKSGFPVGQFFTFNYAGKDANGGSQFYDKDGKITTVPRSYTDYAYAGNAQPKLLLGWTNSFAYKHFDLNIFVRASLGAKVMNATLADLNRPDQVTAYNIPEFSVNESPKDLVAYFYSNRYIESASYLRLDNATLGYSFLSLVKGIQSIRIFVSGNNLALITKYRGIDPEMPLGGLTPGIDNKDYYPRTRSFMVGLNVDFLNNGFMKLVHNYTTLLAAALLLSACTKIDVPVENQLTPQNFPQTDAQFISAAGPAYTNFRGSFCQAYWQLQTLSTDEAILPSRAGGWYDGGRYQQMHYHNWTPDNPIVGDSWTWGFTTISACNRILALFAASKDSPIKTSLAAEIRLLRALMFIT